MRNKSAITADQRLSRRAARQHGVVSTQHLYALGLSRRQVQERVRAARLHRIHRGVYAVATPNLTREGRFMAAVLAAGDGAALSHGSAAWLWGIRDGLLSPIDVTVPRRTGASRGRGSASIARASGWR